MAIAFDASTRSTVSTWGSGTTATWSHTCSGSDRILFVYSFNNDGSGYPTGMTYNGVSMTRIQNQAADGGSFYNSLFYLVAPATGANNIVVTWATATGINSCIAASYTGASQTGVPDSQNTGNVSSSASITVSTTVVASDCWLLGVIRSSNTTLSSGTNGTIRQPGNTNGSQALVDSNGTVGTGSISQTVNVSPNQSMWMTTVSFAPSAGAAVNSGFLGLM